VRARGDVRRGRDQRVVAIEAEQRLERGKARLADGAGAEAGKPEAAPMSEWPAGFARYR
jgi:hypothetical protein